MAWWFRRKGPPPPCFKSDPDPPGAKRVSARGFKSAGFVEPWGVPSISPTYPSIPTHPPIHAIHPSILCSHPSMPSMPSTHPLHNRRGAASQPHAFLQQAWAPPRGRPTRRRPSPRPNTRRRRWHARGQSGSEVLCVFFFFHTCIVSNSFYLVSTSFLLVLSMIGLLA